jgi:hypothetical protein
MRVEWRRSNSQYRRAEEEAGEATAEGAAEVGAGDGCDKVRPPISAITTAASAAAAGGGAWRGRGRPWEGGEQQPRRHGRTTAFVVDPVEAFGFQSFPFALLG